MDSGITSYAVAAALGHASFKTTAESYAQRDVVAGAEHKRALAALNGGELASDAHPLIGVNRSQSFPNPRKTAPTHIAQNGANRKPEQSRGAERDRTVGLLSAIQALSQLSYSPDHP